MTWIKDIHYQSSFKRPRSSEDCLYLSVFTPSNRDPKSKLPVMTFINGGGMLVWSASMYDGSALSANEDVVVVCIQYRLGLLGFYSTADNQVHGNYGFKDQLAALQWIQENIAAFGGDPSSVTIFGTSIGGISVSALVLSPLSKGLFHRAIAQSGAITMKDLVPSRSEDLILLEKAVTILLGCDLASIADCLKKKEKELIALVKAMDFPMVVHVDGDFLPKPVEEMLADKKIHKVPFIIGINNQEFGWTTPLILNVTRIWEGMTRKAATLALQKLLIAARNPKAIPFIIDEYLGDIVDPMEIRERFLDLCSDAMYVIPALQLAKHHRDAGLPVYFYEYQHPPSLLAHMRPGFMKADHSDEQLFVFGGPFLRDGPLFAAEKGENEQLQSRYRVKWFVQLRTIDDLSAG
ncbi:fatty acyl-CoA hydrolase precursor, medium chain-like [Eleutherodactylus coqui]|uniref:fatty acyl-CoA hydrolase precursor, medium chain-like n=1 Tax=Eleutherodactylus coqui TaxID=57060 RepID=UPI00346356E0